MLFEGGPNQCSSTLSFSGKNSQLRDKFMPIQNTLQNFYSAIVWFYFNNKCIKSIRYIIDHVGAS